MRTLKYCLTIVLPLFIFIFIATNVVNLNIISFDSYFYQGVSGFISSDITKIMILISFLGSGEFFSALATLGLILILAFFRKERCSFYAAMVVINLLLSSLLNVSIKYVIHRNRPNILRLVEIGGFSFPSGHSMVSMSFYGFLIYLCFKNCKTAWKYLISSLLAVLIFLIGVSRIYLGVHYTSDVIAGFVLGVLWIGIYSMVVEIRYNKRFANS